VAPSSVRQYADTTKQTIERARPVVKDYVDGCGDRQLPLLHSDATQEEWQCKDVAKLAGPFNAMTDFISAYADALSALSASEGVKYKGQTADVVGAAEKLPGFANDKARIAAVGALRGSPPFSRTLTRRPMRPMRSVHVEAKKIQHRVQAWRG